ncbi:hypothetical protein [Acidocella sp.]|uniref:hypothetical protein n=1 Tax=Acidocella sp. TaxID=50710 RepID=UPI003CFFE17E
MQVRVDKAGHDETATEINNLTTADFGFDVASIPRRDDLPGFYRECFNPWLPPVHGKNFSVREYQCVVHDPLFLR